MRGGGIERNERPRKECMKGCRAPTEIDETKFNVMDVVRDKRVSLHVSCIMFHLETTALPNDRYFKSRRCRICGNSYNQSRTLGSIFARVLVSELQLRRDAVVRAQFLVEATFLIPLRANDYYGIPPTSQLSNPN